MDYNSSLHIPVEDIKLSIRLHYAHCYVATKWHGQLYRAIFFSLSCLFLILGTLVCLQTANALCRLYWENGVLAKHVVTALCFLLSATSFLCGYTIHPAQEALLYLKGKVERELGRICQRPIYLHCDAITAHLSAMAETFPQTDT